jgi:DNA mismatch repair ATPase MutS
LANHSLKQLNIIDEHGNERRGKLSSVEKMLNICITSMGKRRFSYHFLNPTTDTIYLRGEYNMIEHIMKSCTSYEGLPGKLGQIKDIAKLNRQIIMKKIAPKALFQFYKNLFTIDEIYDLVSKDSALLTYLTSNNNNKPDNTVSLYCRDLISFFDSTMD